MKPSQQIELAEVHIPHSLAYKKTSIDKANEVLSLAKSLNRPMRKALPNECAFSREMEEKRNTPPTKAKYREDGYMTAQEIELIHGISQFNILTKRRKGELEFKKEGRNYFYHPDHVLKIEIRTYRKKD